MDDTRPQRRLPPLSVALLSQLAAAAPVLGVAWGVTSLGGGMPPLIVLLLTQGALAALLGKFFGLARWWLPIQFLLPPAVALGLWAAAPSWVYLAAFAGLLLVYWNSAGERVPLYLSNRATWEALGNLLPEKPGLAFVDLGCGFGGVISFLASRRAGRFDGIESAPVPYIVSWLRLKLSGPDNAHLVYGDYWKTDLSGYDAVYCFLSPAPMPEMYEKARSEMRPGSLFISNSFEVPGHDADEVVTLDDRRRTRLHIWRI